MAIYRCKKVRSVVAGGSQQTKSKDAYGSTVLQDSEPIARSEAHSLTIPENHRRIGQQDTRLLTLLG